jgi:CRISPR-associated protein Cas5d
MGNDLRKNSRNGGRSGPLTGTEEAAPDGAPVFTFRIEGYRALFSDPVTRVGGEKHSYHVPTYESVRGMCSSIYWKPTIEWEPESVRVMKRISTWEMGVKPLNINRGGHSLSIYTYLSDVEYQVRARLRWNMQRPGLEKDRDMRKHSAIARRSIDKGGRCDVFLGARDCQGYVYPCEFGSGTGAYDDLAELSFGVMFHSFRWPDTHGGDRLVSCFWRPVMRRGVINFPRPGDPSLFARDVRQMGRGRKYTANVNFTGIEEEYHEFFAEVV